MVLNWLGIAKWLALAAVVVALIGGPILYIGHVTERAYNSGHEAGVFETQLKIDELVLQQKTEREARERVEAQEALNRQDEKVKHDQVVSTVRGKLQDALKAQPQVAGCLASATVTDILRGAAAGQFTPGGTGLPSRSTPSLLTAPPVSSERRTDAPGTR